MSKETEFLVELQDLLTKYKVNMYPFEGQGKDGMWIVVEGDQIDMQVDSLHFETFHVDINYLPESEVTICGPGEINACRELRFPRVPIPHDKIEYEIT